MHYTYWPTGELKTREWARKASPSDAHGITTTYSYFDNGMLHTTSHSDATPAVVLTYTRDGRATTVSDSGGLKVIAYDSGLRATGETYSSGFMSGIGISRPLDAVGRPESFTASRSSNALLTVTYNYAADTGLLHSVSSGSYSAGYEYQANSAIVTSVSHSANSVHRLTSLRTVDALGRPDIVAAVLPATASSPVLAKAEAAYNPATNQRDRAVMADGTVQRYTYDNRGQVTAGWRTVSLSSTGEVEVPGFGRAYAFDTIGNRTAAAANGGSGAAYVTASNSNQYALREVAGIAEALGEAAPDARVVVGSRLADRAGNWFHGQFDVDNTLGPLWPQVDVAAARTGSGSMQVARIPGGRQFVAQTPETFLYDADGNLTQDGRWTYAYDAENRLRTVETRADVAAALGRTFPRLRLTFDYDAQGRRLRKQVYGYEYGSGWNQLDGAGRYWMMVDNNNGTVVTIPNSVGTTKFVYDGWNLVAELNVTSNGLAPNNSPTATYALASAYVWGLDASQTLQGAGGVGGLLCAFPAGSTGPCAPAYDSNSNVVAWVALNSGVVVGAREYGPFGEPLRVTGLAATLMPFGFSTKYTDRETGSVYFGFRYYHAELGRWLNRDPLEEAGGFNLYAYCTNDGINRFDSDGRQSMGFGYLPGNIDPNNSMLAFTPKPSHSSYDGSYHIYSAEYKTIEDRLAKFQKICPKSTFAFTNGDVEIILRDETNILEKRGFKLLGPYDFLEALLRQDSELFHAKGPNTNFQFPDGNTGLGSDVNYFVQGMAWRMNGWSLEEAEVGLDSSIYVYNKWMRGRADSKLRNSKWGIWGYQHLYGYGERRSFGPLIAL